MAFTCSKLTIETLEQGMSMFKVNNWRRSGSFIVNFEHISHVALKFEHATVGWEVLIYDPVSCQYGALLQKLLANLLHGFIKTNVMFFVRYNNFLARNL